MPATLDPRTALVLHDLQRAIVALPTIHPAPEIVARVAKLADAFRAAGLPVILVSVGFSHDKRDAVNVRTAATRPNGFDPGEICLELGPAEDDLLIVKRGWNAFYGTDLDLQLRRRKVSGIVLAGIATSVGIESTARAANERAYELAIASDCVTDFSASAHESSLTNVLPKIAELATADEIELALTRP